MLLFGLGRQDGRLCERPYEACEPGLFGLASELCPLCDLGHDLSGPRFPYRPVLQGLCITTFKELEAKSALTTALPWLPSTDTISPLGGALQKDED